MGQYADDKERRERGEVNWDEMGPELLQAAKALYERIEADTMILDALEHHWSWRSLRDSIIRAEGRAHA